MREGGAAGRSRGFTATYRLQLHAGFPFAAAAEVAPYLKRLGASHLFLSPILRSRSGSEHGYDVVDPTQVDPELGGEEGWIDLVASLHRQGLGILLDIVPNHMGVGAENPYWEDLFSNGQASRWSRWFDIDWNPPRPGLARRVLVPVLADDLERILERGEIGIAFEGGRFRVRYLDHRFPIDPRTVPQLFAPEEPAGEAEGVPPVPALDAVLQELAELPARSATRHADVERRQLEVPRLRRRLAELAAESPEVRGILDARLRAFANGPGAPDRLRRFLDAQVYALAHWRRAAHEINYRRFFDINELIALRMEDPEVFARTHERILGWVRQGAIDGLRVDHVDGLRDPLRYLKRLRAAIRERLPSAAHSFPVIVEKILSPGERLRRSWPVAGTTGYEFLNELESIFVSPEGCSELQVGYQDLVGLRAPAFDFAEIAHRSKLHVLATSLQADVRRLSRILRPLAPGERGARARRRGPGAAIAEVIAALSVYRTYVDPETGEAEAEDRERIEAAVRRAVRRGVVDPALLGAVRAALLRGTEATGGENRARRLAFVARFQQTSGPATAKGVEDTALYRYAPLASLNEVGGEPDRPLENAVPMLHDANLERAREWPRAMVTVETHDTKRSADLRSRLDVLSEIPDLWNDFARRWRRRNRPLRSPAGRGRAPDATTESLLYQSLVGMWPVDEGGPAPVARVREEIQPRLEEYLIKAGREAKTRTSWTDPDERYEEATTRFLRRLLEPDRSPFLDEVRSIVERIARPGLWNALARTLVHLTAPGVPDLYQGGERWSWALVDPDNRRPVDFERAAAVLAEVEAIPANEIADWLRERVDAPYDSALKTFVVHRALAARRQHAALFEEGEYAPLAGEGPAAAHVFAFARRHGSDTVVTAVARLPWTLAAGLPPVAQAWEGTRLALPEAWPSRRWRSLLTGAEVDAALPCPEVFRDAPVALLESVRP